MARCHRADAQMRQSTAHYGPTMGWDYFLRQYNNENRRRGHNFGRGPGGTFVGHGSWIRVVARVFLLSHTLVVSYNNNNNNIIISSLYNNNYYSPAPRTIDPPITIITYQPTCREIAFRKRPVFFSRRRTRPRPYDTRSNGIAK